MGRQTNHKNVVELVHQVKRKQISRITFDSQCILTGIRHSEESKLSSTMMRQMNQQNLLEVVHPVGRKTPWKFVTLHPTASAGLAALDTIVYSERLTSDSRLKSAMGRHLNHTMHLLRNHMPCRCSSYRPNTAHMFDSIFSQMAGFNQRRPGKGEFRHPRNAFRKRNSAF